MKTISKVLMILIIVAVPVSAMFASGAQDEAVVHCESDSGTHCNGGMIDVPERMASGYGIRRAGGY